MKPLSLALALVLMVGGYSALQAEDEDRDPHGTYQGDCGLCHSDEGWKPAPIPGSFSHAKTGFPLEGAHAVLTCRSCHGSLDFSATREACVECHQDVHRGEMGTECAICHTTRSFIERGKMMRSHRLTRFPLTGAHVSLDCNQCHPSSTSGQAAYVNTPMDCEACHLQEYRSTTNPDHAAAGISTSCERCHSTFGFQATRFNHAVTGFPLAGLHRNLDCIDCHDLNRFIKATPDCVACHQADYDATTNPNHLAAGFPTDCGACHTTSGWRRANFRHDSQFFPIYSGEHKGKWSDCSDCHINTTNYSDFTCFTCHPHSDKTKTDKDHKGRSGYRYVSRACYRCHPRGD